LAIALLTCAGSHCNPGTHDTGEYEKIIESAEKKITAVPKTGFVRVEGMMYDTWESASGFSLKAVLAHPSPIHALSRELPVQNSRVMKYSMYLLSSHHYLFPKRSVLQAPL
jgi:hypothetical protein